MVLTGERFEKLVDAIRLYVLCGSVEIGEYHVEFYFQLLKLCQDPLVRGGMSKSLYHLGRTLRTTLSHALLGVLK